MKFEIVEQERYHSEYDDIYEAVVSNPDKSVCVQLEGKHFASITNAVRHRLKNDEARRAIYCIGSSRDQDNDTITLTLIRERVRP